MRVNQSYVWDIKSPNSPCYTINPPSPIVSLAYNHKQTDEIAFGCYNGRVGYLDVRVEKVVHMSDVEFSHHEPVVDLIWLSSRMNNEFVTCSTDGQVCWWDNRKMTKPIDKLYICENDLSKNEDAPKTEDGLPSNLIGGTCLEFVPDHGPKYLIGTEKGSIMLATKKPKKNGELNFNLSYGLQIGRHLGPIYSIKRNPIEYKYFLSVGDWSVNVWEEDMKTPIMKTRYHSSYLTDGCWSPQRPGVFFVTRKDGWMDIWDFYYRQNEVAFSHKVSNSALTTIKLNTVTGVSQIGVTHADIGKFAAIGDSNGTITLLELCSSLYKVQPNEKDTLNEIFSREKRREDHLKYQRQQLDLKKRNATKEKERLEKEAEDAKNVDVDKQMKDIEGIFENNLKQSADDLYKVYLNEDDMTKLLTERLTYGKEKKAVKDIGQAQHVTRVKATLPADYEKKAGALSFTIPNYYPPSKNSVITSFTPTSKDTIVAVVVQEEVDKLIRWKVSQKEGSETELFSLDKKMVWDSSFKDKEPVDLKDIYYVFEDAHKNYIAVDNYGPILLINPSKPQETRIIAECYVTDKCAVAMSGDKKCIYYIDKDESTKIWKQEISTGKKEWFLGDTEDSINEISGFCLVNEETLFVAFKNSRVCRYDMDKRQFERSVALEGTPTFMCSHLNHVAIVGDVVNQKGELSDAHEILILDDELREVARHSLRDFGTVAWMSMRASVSKTPILFVGSTTQLYAMRITKNSGLEKIPINVDLPQIKRDGIHTFQIFKDSLFISDKDGILVGQIKGEIDDPDEMEKLANKLEANHDIIREKEDQIISDRDKKRKEEVEMEEVQKKMKREQEEAERKKRDENLVKEMDPMSQAVGFENSELLYHKITGRLVLIKAPGLIYL